jgi:hypothetical protein
MIPYKYVDFPNLKETVNEILKIIPELHKDTSIYKSYDKEFFSNIKLLKDGVERFNSWNEIFDIAIVSTKANSSLPIHSLRHLLR